MRRRIVQRSVVCGVLLLAGGVWWWSGEEAKDPESPSEPVAKATKPPLARSSELRRPTVAARPVKVPEPEPVLERPPNGFGCVLPEALAEATTVVVVGYPNLLDLPLIQQASGGTVELPVPYATGPFEVTIRGLASQGGEAKGMLFPNPLGGWSCVWEEPEEPAHVSGRVETTEGLAEGRVMVRGCGAYIAADRDGSFYFPTEPEPCTLYAQRRDGAFTLRSDAVEVDPRSGEEVTLSLVMPNFRAAGVGVQVAEHDLGILVERVWPGTPAEHAGVLDGDIIIGLDGYDTVELPVDEFVDVALGPEGTEVAYTVLRDGEEILFDLTREPVEMPRQSEPTVTIIRKAE